MKALFAILITVGLMAATWMASVQIHFDFSWVLLLLSSLWVAIDSKKVGLNRYSTAVSCRPIPLFCGCCLVWFLAFPWYLWARFRIKNGTAVLKRELPANTGPFRRFCHRLWRASETATEWLLVGLFVLAVGIVLFCFEEGRRGPRAWAQYRQELEANGESFDWQAMAPPRVPDSQNFFSAPMISKWFMRGSGETNTSKILSDRLVYTNTCPKVLIAEVTLGAHAQVEKTTNLSLRFNNFESHKKAKEFVQNIAGPSAFGPRGDYSCTLRHLIPTQVQPLHIFLETDKRPTIRELMAFFSNIEEGGGPFLFEPSGTNSWRLYTWFCAASDYLTWSDQFQSEFDLMHEAVKRPFARMDGNYGYSATVPVPNFLSFRAVAQMLAQRAQCELLLGQPEKALQDLTLLNDLRHQLEGSPSHKPMTVVAAMINAAIAGLYAETIADGFRLHAWKEPQLAALQNQLRQIDLIPPLKESVHDEQVSISLIMQTEMSRFLARRWPNATLAEAGKIMRPSKILWGFAYFNMMKAVSIEQSLFESIDTSKNIILPLKVDQYHREMDSLYHLRFWQAFPHRWLAATAAPNLVNTVPTAARYQTEINEAQIACVLERHRLARGSYPESLEQLSPDLAGRLPHDLIGGQPLKYCRTSEGGFQLCSVGWSGECPIYSVRWDASGTVARLHPTDGNGYWVKQ